MIRLSLAGDDVVVLNDAKDAEELVSKRIYLDQIDRRDLLFDNSLIVDLRIIHLGNPLSTLESTSRKIRDSSC